MTVAPAVPGELLVSVAGTIVDLSWDGVTGASSYKIYRHSSDDSTDAINIGSTAAENTSDTPGAGPWYYWVKACAGENNCSGFSAVSDQMTVAPAVPESLSVSAIGTLVDLSWDSVADAQYYEIYRSDTSGDPSPYLRPTYTSTELPPPTSYDETVDAGIWYYRIKACAQRSNCSDYSDQAQTAFLSNLNDTGITWGGNYPSGNNATCTGQDSSNDSLSPQDCHQGRDADNSDDGDGHAGFSFTRLDASGDAHTGSGTYSEQPWSCVRDNVTGLVWEVKTNDDTTHDRDNAYTWDGWSALVASADNSQLCGRTGWRVPTRDELVSIVNFGTTYPAIDRNYFPNTPSLDFWTSLPKASSTSDAWSVNFRFGNSSTAARVDAKRVRLVHGGRLQGKGADYDDWTNDRYRVHDDGTVTDTITGLMWKRCAEGMDLSPDGSACTGSASIMTWQAALQVASDSTSDGYSDWRLPNIKELISLVALNKSNPAINTTIFPPDTESPNTDLSRFWFWWSSSPNDNNPRYIWAVRSNYGGDGGYFRDTTFIVRLVRGGQ